MRYVVEHQGMGTVLTMTYFVDSPRLLSGELSFLIDCIDFEEVSDLITRVEKVIISNMIVIICSKFGLKISFSFLPISVSDKLTKG